jgi:hypothetical protein
MGDYKFTMIEPYYITRKFISEVFFIMYLFNITRFTSLNSLYEIKKICTDIALNVIKDGAYYGYVANGGDGIILQELPIGYCRSRYSVNNMPAIEFNMKYFDDAFKDPAYRMRVLNLFPKEFSKGYVMYKQNKL